MCITSIINVPCLTRFNRMGILDSKNSRIGISSNNRSVTICIGKFSTYNVPSLFLCKGTRKSNRFYCLQKSITRARCNLCLFFKRIPGTNKICIHEPAGCVKIFPRTRLDCSGKYCRGVTVKMSISIM